MSETITMIESAMRADTEALRVIGQNIANAEVPAYRRQIAVAPEQFAGIVDSMASGTAEGRQQTSSLGVALDTRPGMLKVTGQPLDLAIEGRGYFVVQTDRGQLFTRRGDFHVSAEGLLVTASGERVLGTGGPIAVGTAQPEISADGTVRVAGDALDQLQIVSFVDDAVLEYVGHGSYANPGGASEVSETSPSVRQGALEASNVAPVGEMVKLIETMRHFETAQRFVRGYDQMMEKAISELGKID